MELALFLSPVALIATLNAIAWILGERGTLLLPAAQAFPAVDWKAAPVSEKPVSTEAANDAVERLAA